MRELSGVLSQIIAQKRIDVERRLGALSLDAVRTLGQNALMLRRGEHHPRNVLFDALKQEGARFIFEIKRRSPSGALLREGADILQTVRGLRATADAISVLTDEPFFGGSLEDLRAVRGAFTGPILAKDFIIDARQVGEAAAAGADAVLIMLSVLDDDEAGLMLEEAERVGIEAVVEVHDESELERALVLRPQIIGMNNRDLKSLKIDLELTRRLAPRIPKEAAALCESGIHSRDDVVSLSAFVDGFLVGSALMGAIDPRQAARDLVFGPVKVCGITNNADAMSAISAGASYLGFVFAPHSARYLRSVEAEPAIRAARSLGVKSVGVFVDAPLPEVAELANGLTLDAVQLHGEEDEAYIAGLRVLIAPHIEIWKAIGVAESAQAAPQIETSADKIVFDTKSAQTWGGSGQRFDWRVIAGRRDLHRALLAGGLTPSNAQAASKVGAYALDVSSGVEGGPGVKDSAKLRAFFEALRPHARESGDVLR